MKLGFPGFRRFFGVIAALVALSAAIQPTAAQTNQTNSFWDVDQSTVETSDADQPIMVGETELTWTGDWEYSFEEDVQAMLIKELDSGSAVVATYGVFDDDYAVDAEAAMQTLFDPVVEGADVEGGSVQESVSGELEGGGIWKVYTLDEPGLSLSLVITVSQTDSGEFVISTLFTETDVFSDSVTTAQEEIMLNGEPTFLAGIDPAEVTVNLSPAVESTSDPGPTVEPTSELEPTADDQPIMVGGTELTWTGDWEYSFDQDVQAMFSQGVPGSATLQVAAYGVFSDDYALDAEAALETYIAALGQGGTTIPLETGSGELEDGTIWKVYSLSFGGQELEFSVIVNVSQTENGEFEISMVVAEIDAFENSISAAQSEIMLNGEPIFLEGIDPVEVTADLGDQASPVASPEATPAS